MAVSLMLVLSVLGAARARPEMRAPNGAVATRAPVPKPAFSFAPLGGQNMGNACACSNPTGSRGESINFTRASSAYCTKPGTGLTGIANGDLVLCSSNQARVMPSVPNGPLGLLMEPAATNNSLYSQEIGGTGWNLAGTAPTVTLNSGTAPDGSSTASKIDFPAITAGSARSIVFTSTGASMVTAIGSVYLKGVTGSGTMYFNIFNNTGCGGSAARVECSFNSTSWTRCVSNAETTNATRYIVFGPDRACNNPSDSSPAQSVYLWQSQLESGSHPTSPIKTTGAATRAEDLAYVSGLSIGTTTRLSMSGQIYQTNSTTPAADSYYMTVQQSNAHAYSAFYYSGGLPYCGNTNANDVLNPAPAEGPTSWWCSFSDGASDRVTGQAAGLNMATNLNAALGVSNSAQIGLGQRSGTSGQGGAVYINFCADPNELRCRK